MCTWCRESRDEDEATPLTMERGRPKVFVDDEKLQQLRTQGFTWDQISTLMGGISGKTLQRRAREFNISYYTNISDTNLDAAVSQIISHFPNSGEVMINGHLVSQQVL